MPEPIKTEVDKLFENLPSEDKKEQDIFDEKKEPEKVIEKVEEKEEEGESEVRKNRRHRRLEEQLQRERESNIALNERLKVLAEQDKVIKESDGAIDPRLIRVFGTTDEAKEIARHFTEILSETEQKARESVIREIEQRENSVREEQAQYEKQIDSELEAIEDEFNVDLTSDTPKATKMRKEFLGLVQTLSPKDEDGTITGYADFGATFEQYQKSIPKVDNTRREEIADKSMQRSGQNGSSEKTITPGFRGWEKDYNL